MPAEREEGGCCSGSVAVVHLHAACMSQCPWPRYLKSHLQMQPMACGCEWKVSASNKIKIS